MRRSVLLLVLAVAVSALTGPASAYGAGATLVTSDATPYVGQEVVFTVDLGTPGVRPITLQRNAGSSWADTRTAQTTEDGTQTFQLGTLAPVRTFRVVAPTAPGLESVTSNPVTLTTRPITSAPVTATLTASTTTPYVGQPVTLTGELGTPDPRPVILQRDAGTGWANTREAVSQAGGSVSFTLGTAARVRKFRLLAPSSGTDGPVLSAAVTLRTLPNPLDVVISRVGRSSKIQGDAIGAPGLAGREFAIQVAGRDGWRAYGASTGDNEGRAHFEELLRDPTTRYRVVARAFNGAPKVISRAYTVS